MICDGFELGSILAKEAYEDGGGLLGCELKEILGAHRYK